MAACVSEATYCWAASGSWAARIRACSMACHTGQPAQALDGPSSRIVRYGYSQIHTAVEAMRPSRAGPGTWARWQVGYGIGEVLRIINLPPTKARCVPAAGGVKTVEKRRNYAFRPEYSARRPPIFAPGTRN